jgi:hypothetical protein
MNKESIDQDETSFNLNLSYGIKLKQ